MRVTSFEERVRIGKLSRKSLTDRQIAMQLGLSIYTVRKWRRRQKQGKEGLVSQMGRPICGALSTFPKDLLALLGMWRKQHPGWGPKTLRTELALDERFVGKRLPSRSSIARWLKENRWVRLYEKHTELPCEAKLPSVQACHEEWEMDANGYQRVSGLGLVSLIDINDTFSRVRLLSHPCWLGHRHIQRFPSTEDYQQALRLAFCQWGLPDRLATDHDRIFYDETSKSPFPTRFHLWLMALGIQLSFGRLRVPEDQAITERSHQIWDHQVLEGSHFETLEQLRLALNQRQIFLNETFPCASLHDQPPLVAHPQARIPRRPYRPEYETELMDLQCIYDYLHQGQWFRKISAVGTISIGGHIYHLGYDWRPDHHVEVTFEPSDISFVCRTASGKEKRFPAAGLSKADFISELLPFQLPSFQMALPFSWNEWRAFLYSEMPA